MEQSFQLHELGHELVYLGKLGKTRGLKGQIYCYTDGPDQDFFFHHLPAKIEQIPIFVFPKDFWEQLAEDKDLPSVYRFLTSPKRLVNLEQWALPCSGLQWMAHQKEYLLTFQAYQSPELAQSLVGKLVYGLRAKLHGPASNRAYAPTDLWGFAVRVVDDLSYITHITDCYYNGAGQLIYRLASGAEFLNHPSFIQEIDWEQRKMVLSRQWEDEREDQPEDPQRQD